MSIRHTASPASPNKRRLATARSALAKAEQGRAGQPVRIPRKVNLDRRFIASAVNYQRCAKAYMAAVSGWHTFAAGQDFDDPAHGEHHRRVCGTRQALCQADFEFTADCNALGVQP